MGKKIPPRKLSVVVNSRRPSKGLVVLYDATSTLQDQLRLAGEVPDYSSSLPFSQTFSVCNLEDEELALAYKIQPVRKLPPLPILPEENGEDEAKKYEEEAKKDEEDPMTFLSRGAERRWAYRNVLGIGFSFLFVFTSFLGLQNLQSSINSDGGLGLTSLAVLYVFFMLFGIVSPSVLSILGTKYSLVAGMLCFLLYTLSNFYPSWYTLVPASVIVGMGSALIWAAASSHIVEVAVIVAPKLKADKNHLISTFTGLFFLCFQIAQVPGNLASSLILFPYGGLNRTVSDSKEHNSSATDYCQQSTAAGQEFEAQYLYILCAVYSLCVCVGILFSVFMITHLGTNKAFFSSTRKFELFVKEPLLDLFKVLRNYKMVLIAPISIFNGLEQSFAFGTFTVSEQRLYV